MQEQVVPGSGGRSGVAHGVEERDEKRVGDERRRALVEAACELIVEKGFEGLRVRDIAARVGINHATLHYHFPTKEELIRAVSDRLVEQLKGEDGVEERPFCDGTPCGPLREHLAEHFDKVLLLMDRSPELFIALSELNLRSLRDPTTAKVMGERDKDWHAFLSSELEAGVRDGTVRPDIDTEAAAQVIMSIFKGMAFRRDRGEMDPQRMVRQLEKWLFTPKDEDGSPAA